MKNGKLEPNDSDTLQSIYNKLTVNGELKEPLTVEEQVLLFSVSKWIKKNVKKDNMNKDCNGCFGAAGDDCQRCQEADERPLKLDIAPELAIAAYNILIQFCRQQEATEDGTCCRCILYDHCPAKSDTVPEEWEEMPLLFLDGNTVTYMKDGQIKRITCSRKEEAQELFEEVKRGKKMV